MQRPGFLAAVTAAAFAPLVLPPGRAAAAAPELPKLVAGQRYVAFAVSDSATVIDFAGPWEVFQDVSLPGDPNNGAFVPFLVGPSSAPVEATDGMHIVPSFTFENAPPAHIVVVGAQRGAPGLVPWIARQAKTADTIMSVCTGAFKVAQAGLFDGKSATTHHDFYDKFEQQFPKVKLVRGPRFVDEGKICSAGGLTSGMDLALHVVERYHGKKIADDVAGYMEFVRTPRPNVARG